MSSTDVQLATQFLSTLAEGARTGDFEEVYPFLAPDVHCLTPLRNLHGIGEVRSELIWFLPRARVKVDFEQELTDLGGGRIVSDIHATYRDESSGAIAYRGNHRIELTIRDGKIAALEIRVGG